jgi:formylmethanofuran dehydrogenase subunit E
MDKILKQIENFHGHLGPYVVVGYRMGLIAKEKLNGNPFSLNAIVWTNTAPPTSCVIDGIQISSGCTLGKGNISIKKSDIIKAEFSNNDGKFLQIVLKPEIKDEIENSINSRNIASHAEKIFKRPDFELFEIKN